MRRMIAVLALALALLGVAVAAAQPSMVRQAVRAGYHRLDAIVHGIAVRRDVMVTMPDGVRLATDVYLPRIPPEGLPAVLVRLPYGKSGGGNFWARRFSRNGYAVVVQDMRGRYSSEGEFAPYEHEVSDGSAAIDWIAEQPWSNGRIATAGCSSLGESQAILAKARNPRHRALIAEAAGGAIGAGGASRAYSAVYEGGVPNLAAPLGWFLRDGGKTPDAMGGPAADLARIVRELPSGTLVSRHRVSPTDYEDFLASFEDAAYWRRLGYLDADDRFSAPTLHVNSWHDPAVRGTFEIAALMRRNADTDEARENQPVLIGPGNHCALDQAFAEGRVGDMPIDPAAAMDFEALHLAWLDHWLRDAPLPALPAYTYYLLGADRWETSDAWPPAGSSPVPWYLDSGGGLEMRPGPSGSLTYRYDPLDPTPSLGGPDCCSGQPDLRAGPIDQRANAARPDVLGFVSAPLAAPLTIAGGVAAELPLSSDAPDTDLVAILLDVKPDGTMLAVQQGALRLRYRDGFDAPQLMAPGEVVAAAIDMRPIAYEFAAGHRIGLHLSSSSFPRLERNLNTGRANHLETEARVANTTVHFGGATGSRLILPVRASP